MKPWSGKFTVVNFPGGFVFDTKRGNQP